MYPSNCKRQPSALNRAPANRSSPATAISGTSLARPRRPENPPTQALSVAPSNLLQAPVEMKPPPRSHNDNITIHVYDDAKKVNRDFACPKQVLVQKMKYFESHLEKCETPDDLDISVHCDVDIFDWLVRYMLDRDRPKLQLENVISILISSDFLQMKELACECLEFVCEKLDEVVKLPIDMNCLNQKLLNRLAGITAAEQLDALSDRRDKLQGKLFMKKLEHLFEDENNSLNRCVYCNRLFTGWQREQMVCEKARIFIDFHGNVIAQHVPDRN